MKKLSITKRLITIGASNKADKSKCCNDEIIQSRVYPFELYCYKCSKTIRYEEQVQWKKNN